MIRTKIGDRVNDSSQAALAVIDMLYFSFFFIFTANDRNHSVAIMKPVLILIAILIRSSIFRIR